MAITAVTVHHLLDLLSAVGTLTARKMSGEYGLPPDRDRVRPDPMPAAQFGHQLIKGQVALFLDPVFNPTCHARQPAVPTIAALAAWPQATRWRASNARCRLGRTPKRHDRKTFSIPAFLSMGKTASSVLDFLAPQ